MVPRPESSCPEAAQRETERQRQRESSLVSCASAQICHTPSFLVTKKPGKYVTLSCCTCKVLSGLESVCSAGGHPPPKFRLPRAPRITQNPLLPPDPSRPEGWSSSRNEAACQDATDQEAIENQGVSVKVAGTHRTKSTKNVEQNPARGGTKGYGKGHKPPPSSVFDEHQEMKTSGK